MKPTFALFVVAGVVALTLVVEETSAAAPLCPHCVCPPSYSPVCGYRKSTNTTRGFPSRCVLECTNMCRKKKFEFVFNGRCGKWAGPEAAPTPQAVAATTTTTTLPPVPAEPDVEEEVNVLEPTYER